MNIEPIDLRPASTQEMRWLWGMNALWIAGIVVCIAWWQWQLKFRADEETVVSARTQALAASAASLIKQEENERAAQATLLLKNELSFDWDEVLKALEDAQVNGVSVESFRIDAVKKEINVVLTFTDYAQVGEYQKQLNARLKSQLCGVTVAERRENSQNGGKATLACAEWSMH